MNTPQPKTTESWLGPDRAVLQNRLTRYPELKPSEKHVLDWAGNLLKRKPPGYQDTVDKITGEFLIGGYLEDKEKIKTMDPRTIVMAASYERAHKVFEAVLYLGYAFRLTGEKSFALAAIGWMREAASWPLWTHPGWMMGKGEEKRVPVYGEGESFATSVLLQAMAIGLELCKEVMNDHDLFDVLGTVVKNAERIKSDYEYGRPWYFCFKSAESNQWTIQTAALGIAGLAAMPWVPKADSWYELGKKLTLEALDAQSPDGAYIEGVHYASYGTKDVVIFAEMAAAKGDFSMVQHPHLSNLPDWYVQMTFPDEKRHININDTFQYSWAMENHPREISKYAFVMYRRQFVWFQRRYPGKGFGSYLKNVLGGLPESPWSLAWYNPETPDPSPHRYAKGFKSYPTLGFHGFRETVDGIATLAVLVAGAPQRGHKHPDNQSVIFSAGEDTLLCDAGVCSYGDPDAGNYFQRTLAHNTFQLDGKEQIHGSGGTCLSHGSSGPWRWITTEADAGYPGLEKVRRSLFFSSKQKTFWIADFFRFHEAGEHAVEWFWHGEGAMRAQTNGWFQKGKSLDMDMQIVSPEVTAFSLNPRDGFLDGPEKPRAAYVSVNKTMTGKEGLFLFQFRWGRPLNPENGKSPVAFQNNRIKIKNGLTEIHWNGSGVPKKMILGIL